MNVPSNESISLCDLHLSALRGQARRSLKLIVEEVIQIEALRLHLSVELYRRHESTSVQVQVPPRLV